MVRLLIALALAGLTSIPCLAQADEKNAPPAQPAANTQKQFYRLAFVVQELENGRLVNSRSYSTVMSEMKSSSIRAGAKVPFSSTSGANTQWQQIDVGVSIDCHRLQVTSNIVFLDIKAEISSIMDNHAENSPPPSLPIIRQNQWESNVVLPLKQPTVIFSSDDPASKRTMQLKLTVTPI
jgi:hypothetical protein